MVDNLEIKTTGPLPSGIRNIMPQLLNDTKKLPPCQRVFRKGLFLK